MANQPQNNPFPTIQPAGPTITAQEFARMQANVANALKNLTPSQTASAQTSAVIASYYISSNQAVAGGAIINYDTKIIDTGGSKPLVSTGAGSWKFTAPSSDNYEISVNVGVSGGGYDVFLNIQNVTFCILSQGGAISYGTIIVPLKANDVVSLISSSPQTYMGGTGVTLLNFVGIKRVA